MTGPPLCTSCGAPRLLWHHGVEQAAGPGRSRPDGECYWCAKVTASRNGGLPVASPPLPTDNLARLLRAWDQLDERDDGRMRGIRYSVRLGRTTLELTT